jgi:hypothetical protein
LGPPFAWPLSIFKDIVKGWNFGPWLLPSHRR